MFAKSFVSIDGVTRWMPVTQIPKRVRRQALGGAFMSWDKQRRGWQVGERAWMVSRKSQNALNRRVRGIGEAADFGRQGLRTSDVADWRRFRREGSRSPHAVSYARSRAEQLDPKARGYTDLVGLKRSLDPSNWYGRSVGQIPTPAQVRRHEGRHLVQPLPKSRGPRLTRAQRNELKASLRGRVHYDARMDQLAARSEAWADVGSRMTSGHVNAEGPNGAANTLSYLRAREKMSRGIVGRADRGVLVDQPSSGPVVDSLRVRAKLHRRAKRDQGRFGLV